MHRLECPCGLVVSTARSQVRCIRCGSVLGVGPNLPPPFSTARADTQQEPSPARTETTPDASPPPAGSPLAGETDPSETIRLGLNALPHGTT